MNEVRTLKSLLDDIRIALLSKASRFNPDETDNDKVTLRSAAIFNAINGMGDCGVVDGVASHEIDDKEDEKLFSNIKTEKYPNFDHNERPALDYVEFKARCISSIVAFVRRRFPGEAILEMKEYDEMATELLNAIQITVDERNK